MSLAPTHGRTGAGLSGALLHAPQRFDFFQAMRLLGHVARRQGMPPPGDDVPPDQELARFRVVPGLSFPTSALAPVKDRAASDQPNVVELAVTFLGLTGPNGVLPYHYTRLLLERVRAKDTSTRDFFDLFQRRLVTLFHRAWEKYRLPFTFERTRLDAGIHEPDPATQVLHCLSGFGTEHLRGRLQVADGAFVYYAGHFAHYPRSALALEGMLAEYFDIPVQVLQLQGQWLYLEPEDCSRMPTLGDPEGRNCLVGVSLMAGSRIWDIQSRFRLRLGPLSYEQFRRLLPGGDMLLPVGQFARTYVGAELDFDVQLVLRREEVPTCQLGDEAMLGWNTWVRADEMPRDAEDTICLVEDFV